MGQWNTEMLTGLHQQPTPHLFCTIPHICSTPLNTSAVAHTHTHTHLRISWVHSSTWLPLIILFIFPFIHCRASIRCTLDKPIRFPFLPVFIYMQLSSKTNSRPCTADSISVSPSCSHYTAHELWIGVSVRTRSDRSSKGQALAGCEKIDDGEHSSSFSSLSTLALW